MKSMTKKKEKSVKHLFQGIDIANFNKESVMNKNTPITGAILAALTILSASPAVHAGPPKTPSRASQYQVGGESAGGGKPLSMPTTEQRIES